MINRIETLGSTLCTSIFTEDYCSQISGRDMAALGLLVATTLGALYLGHKMCTTRLFSRVQKLDIQEFQKEQKNFLEFINLLQPNFITEAYWKGTNVLFKIITEQNDAALKIIVDKGVPIQTLQESINSLEPKYYEFKKAEFEGQKQPYLKKIQEYDQQIQACELLLRKKSTKSSPLAQSFNQNWKDLKSHALGVLKTKA